MGEPRSYASRMHWITVGQKEFPHIWGFKLAKFEGRTGVESWVTAVTTGDFESVFMTMSWSPSKLVTWACSVTSVCFPSELDCLRSQSFNGAGVCSLRGSDRETASLASLLGVVP